MTTDITPAADSSSSHAAGAARRTRWTSRKAPARPPHPDQGRAAEKLKKPDWIRVKAGSPTTRFYEIKDILRANNLVTVCEEASCPNIGECFGKGTRPS
jgi:lipoic acid synthetase